MTTKLSELYRYIDALEANGNQSLDVAVLRALVDEVEAEASGMIAEAEKRHEDFLDKLEPQLKRIESKLNKISTEQMKSMDILEIPYIKERGHG